MNRVSGAVLVVVIGATLLVSACRSEPTQTTSAPAGTSAAPVVPQQAPPVESSPVRASAAGYDGPLPPIPMAPFVTDPMLVRTVYEFAARQPEVLRYMPCFCGCERNGHKGNEDCFIAGRAADGRPQWDAHGMG